MVHISIKMKFKVLAFLTVFFNGFECSKILVLYPTVGRSHVIPLQTLSLALIDMGHEITFVSPFPLDKEVKNYRDVKIPFDEADKEFLSEITKNPKANGFISVFLRMTTMIYRLGNETLQMNEMQKMMKEEKFDLVIVGYFMSEFMLGVADHFKCASILFKASATTSVISQALGNPLGTSGTPHALLAPLTMDFVGRLKTFVATGVELLVGQYLKYKARQVYE